MGDAASPGTSLAGSAPLLDGKDRRRRSRGQDEELPRLRRLEHRRHFAARRARRSRAPAARRCRSPTDRDARSGSARRPRRSSRATRRWSWRSGWPLAARRRSSRRSRLPVGTNTRSRAGSAASTDHAFAAPVLRAAAAPSGVGRIGGILRNRIPRPPPGAGTRVLGADLAARRVRSAVVGDAGADDHRPLTTPEATSARTRAALPAGCGVPRTRSTTLRCRSRRTASVARVEGDQPAVDRGDEHTHGRTAVALRAGSSQVETPRLAKSPKPPCGRRRVERPALCPGLRVECDHPADRRDQVHHSSTTTGVTSSIVGRPREGPAAVSPV